MHRCMKTVLISQSFKTIDSEECLIAWENENRIRDMEKAIENTQYNPSLVKHGIYVLMHTYVCNCMNTFIHDYKEMLSKC